MSSVASFFSRVDAAAPPSRRPSAFLRVSCPVPLSLSSETYGDRGASTGILLSVQRPRVSMPLTRRPFVVRFRRVILFSKLGHTHCNTHFVRKREVKVTSAAHVAVDSSMATFTFVSFLCCQGREARREADVGEKRPPACQAVHSVRMLCLTRKALRWFTARRPGRALLAVAVAGACVHRRAPAWLDGRV